MKKNSNYEWPWKLSSGDDISISNLAKDTVKTVVSRYGTADPFTIADKLNVEYFYMPLGTHPFGDTSYDHHDPIVILNESIRESPQRYYTLGHELGHIIMHADLTGYHSGIWSYGRYESQANQFSTALMGLLYIEENGHQPDSYYDLVHQYGSPIDFIN
ncbi:ImmA/IrrE family metallo-endopeptidase [Lentilactobacillus hilgardii]|uniref:ImmA/IrrE family metallo-endopeptidase n=1 Tax=Lentilactobacillus hilgardii TaxID=1588 RepID=UPI0021A3FCF5|nr:ImmA/IrrE family metallo-endopeptidase [Lentilactobacillus hilgardii]MCT3398566.1 ImmA/IrrE family metallo-endopeptidase [Lentilactobacillus hilgardii]